MKMKTMMTIRMTQIKIKHWRKKLPLSNYPRISHTSKTNSLSAEKTIRFRNNRKQTKKLKVIKLMAMTMMKNTHKIKTRILFLAKKTLNNSLHNSSKKMTKPRTKRRTMGSKNNSSSLKSR